MRAVRHGLAVVPSLAGPALALPLRALLVKADSFGPALYETTRDSIPLGRLAVPEDIARVVFFLASPDAGWITGQSIVVDGGQTLTGS